MARPHRSSCEPIVSVYFSTEIRQQLVELDGEQCAYCQTSVNNTGQLLTIDHIIPRSQGGLTELANLCFCCRGCNEFKGHKTSAIDPLTGEQSPFYHPRQQYWGEHFKWDETSTLLVGLSAIGRVTVVGLNINNATIVSARRRWVSVGWHPPK